MAVAPVAEKQSHGGVEARSRRYIEALACCLAADVRHTPALTAAPHCAQADSLVYQAEKQVKELADKAPEENKAKVGDKIKVRRLHDCNNHAGGRLSLARLRLSVLMCGWGVRGTPMHSAALAALSRYQRVRILCAHGMLLPFFCPQL